MKKLSLLALALTWALAALAQTPEEIVSRMEAEMEKHEQEGVIMTVDTKIPILGTFSIKTHTLGNKTYMITKALGKELTGWSDGETSWTYNPQTNEITVEKDKHLNDGDAQMLEGVADGYDLSVKKETATEWTIQCKKSKSNTDKDAPKTMEIVIAKDSYYPVSLSAKLSGVSVKMYDFGFGVDEQTVTFDINKFPGATVVEKADTEEEKGKKK